MTAYLIASCQKLSRRTLDLADFNCPDRRRADTMRIARIACCRVAGCRQVLPKASRRAVMSAEIIERGRGPEIKGTRITVYSIMDYLGDGIESSQIAAELRLTVAEVEAAITYIKA